ncbi:TolC family protein [Fulvivirga imtechensis]|uniref:TolC family protein n=1 Tax=Fulvivirga imtechensis TaxID=881893 RepID=UPI001FE16B42|nr:TolC family protein [Fulvivirga imtechensis]
MRFIYTIVLILIIGTAYGQQVQQLTLEDIIERARAQSPSAKQAETRKENRYWQYRFYKSNYNPQLRLNGNLPGYNRDFARNTIGEFQPREQYTSFINLGLNQPIAITGGNLSVNSSLDYFNNASTDFTQYNSTVVNIRLDQPLFAFNPLKWDKKTEPLRYEESKRDFVEEMEAISREAVDRFFSYLDAQINLQIAQFNLANNDTIYKIEQGRYNIGTTSKDKLLQVELQLLRSRQDVAQANLDMETSKLALRSFIGISIDESIELALPEAIPAFDVDFDEALKYARDNRADFIAFERRKLEAERAVAQARGERFESNLSASLGYNNLTSQLQEAYNDPNAQERVNITFSIPILDWGRNKARMQTALANQRLTDYVIAQDEQNFEQEIITQVRRFEMLRTQLEITKKSDEVAQERYTVAQNRYLIGKIDITNLNIALTEKDNAKRSYVNALRAFWTAYFDLRRLTLYDFVNNTLLYKPEE